MHTVPKLDQQRLEIVRKPKARGTCVLHSEEQVLVRHHGSFWHGFDEDRQAPTMRPHQLLPPCSVEELLIIAPHGVNEINLKMLLGIINLLWCHDKTNQILLREILQAKEAHLL